MLISSQVSASWAAKKMLVVVPRTPLVLALGEALLELRHVLVEEVDAGAVPPAQRQHVVDHLHVAEAAAGLVEDEVNEPLVLNPPRTSARYKVEMTSRVHPIIGRRWIAGTMTYTDNPRPARSSPGSKLLARRLAAAAGEDMKRSIRLEVERIDSNSSFPACDRTCLSRARTPPQAVEPWSAATVSSSSFRLARMLHTVCRWQSSGAPKFRTAALPPR